MNPRTRIPATAAQAVVLLALLSPGSASAWKSLPDRTNVFWVPADSVSACPAGDSVVAGAPARLRVALRYLGDPLPTPRAGVPPESLVLRLAPLPGPAPPVAHDLSVALGVAGVFADDSTDDAGEARFTVPSLSGNGRLALTLLVAGEEVGRDTVTIRGADTDGDGRVSGADDVPDLDYDGVVGASDQVLAAAHAGHGHRTALHGTPVRRTDLCGTCPEETEGTLGESGAAWSPDGRTLAFTRFTGPLADCAVHLVPADPGAGDAMVPFTFPPAGVHDYDPDWSPLGIEIAFDRGDSACYRKGIPGVNADTTLHLITRNDDGTPLHRGDITPAISPDGRRVAFSRKGPEGYWHLWTIPIEGMEAGAVPTQLTATLYASDLYPRWSPDGEWIYVDRQNGFDGARRIYRVRATGVEEDSLLAPTGFEAGSPGLSPDGVVVAAGVGTHTVVAPRVLEAALPAQATLVRAIPAFADYTLTEDYPLLLPRFSPDGTRIALRASPPDHPGELPQIWATRRNMSLPPVLHTVAGLPVAPATPFVDLAAVPGGHLAFAATASDPENDPLAWTAFYLRADLGMSFAPVGAAFEWTPPVAAADSTFTVRFQVTTPSGGTAYALARIHVSGTVDVGPAETAAVSLLPPRPNPCAGTAILPFDLPAAARVRLEILDVAGRRVARVLDAPLGAGRHEVRWSAGPTVRPGIYRCRLTAGPRHLERTIVLVR